MKKLFIIIISSLLLLSCSNKSNVELISDKLNELTGNPDFSKTEMNELRNGYYVCHITQDNIKNDKKNYSVLYELQDYIYNELNVTCDEKSLVSDNIEIQYESSEAIITTTYKYHDIGPKNHPIMYNDCTIVIQLK